MQFSVIIPLYNKAAHVQRALDSVLVQTWSDFEVIVVDDGSTDGGADVVRRCMDPRARLIVQANAGASAARNLGASVAKGEWLAFIDADDLWMPTYLARVHEAIRANPGCRFVAAGYVMKDGAGRQRPILLDQTASLSIAPVRAFFEAFARVPIVWTGTVVLRRDFFLEIGGFPTGVSRGEDKDTWARAALRAPCIYINEPLAVYFTEVPEQATRQKCASRPPIFDTLLAAVASPATHLDVKQHALDYIAQRLPDAVVAGRLRASDIFRSIEVAVGFHRKAGAGLWGVAIFVGELMRGLLSEVLVQVWSLAKRPGRILRSRLPQSQRLHMVASGAQPVRRTSAVARFWSRCFVEKGK